MSLGQTIMSHIHYIAGQTDAAAQYQAYLERSQAARMAKEKEKALKKAGVRPFESYIDPDQDSGADPREDGAPDEENDPETGGFSAKA